MTDDMTDEKLFLLCKQYGAQALEARRKFAGLLPEVFRRKLYEKKGFGSIYHFAAVLAGMSNEQVDVVLRLEKRFEDKPVLKNALVEGKVSASKLARVASIATKENQEELAHKAEILTNRALEVFVKDEKSPHVHSNPQDTLPDVNILEYLSLELQKNLIKRHKKGININSLLTELLEKHDAEIEEDKETLSKEAGPVKSKYIKVRVRKVLRAEHGNKCSMPHCNKKAKVIHHTRRFALSKRHDPQFLAPLCQEHHEIAHAVDVRYQQKLKL